MTSSSNRAYIAAVSTLALSIATAHSQVASTCPTGMGLHVFSGGDWPASLIASGDNAPATTVTVPVSGASGQTPTMTLTPSLPAALNVFGGTFFYRGFSSAPTATTYGFGIRATGPAVNTLINTTFSFSVPVYNLTIKVADLDYTPSFGSEIISSVLPAAGWTFGPAPTSPAQFIATATDIRAAQSLVGCDDWNAATCDVQMRYTAAPLSAAAFAYTAQTAGATAYVREVSFCLPTPDAPKVPSLTMLSQILLGLGLAMVAIGFLKRR